jgi:minichromosome maintenance protein 10
MDSDPLMSLAQALDDDRPPLNSNIPSNPQHSSRTPLLRKSSTGAIPVTHLSRFHTDTAPQRIQGFRPPPTTSGCKPDAGTAALQAAQGYKDLGQGSFIQRHSGLKVKNPLVSSSQLESRLSKRSIVRLAQLKSRANSHALGTSWAVIAAVGEVSAPRETAAGKPYSTWKLTDLDATSVTVFLFGRAHHDLKTDAKPGTLVALLSTKVRCEGGRFSLSVDNSDQVMVLGTAVEFGFCKATTKDGNPCKVPVNVVRCPFCSYHVSTEFNRLQSKRIELQGGSLKGVYRPAMQSSLKWQTGKFASADAPIRPILPAISQESLREAAAKAAGRGSAAGARYLRTVADPLGVRAEIAETDEMRLKRSRMAPGTAPIPLPRTAKVVVSEPQTAASNKRKKTAARGGSESTSKDGREGAAPSKRGRGSKAQGGVDEVGKDMVCLDDDETDDAPVGYNNHDARRTLASSERAQRQTVGNVARCTSATASLVSSGDDARQRAAQIIKASQQRPKPTSTLVPDFLAEPLKQREEESRRTEEMRLATFVGAHADDPDEAELDNDQGLRCTVATGAQKCNSVGGRLRQQPERTRSDAAGTKKVGATKTSKPTQGGLSAAFGSVIAEMEAQRASGEVPRGSLYKDLVEEEDQRQMMDMMDVLEKKDQMAQKMDSIKSLEVMAWHCEICDSLTSFRSSACASVHPGALKKVKATKRWWKCGGCGGRFETVGVRYPKGQCPRCKVAGTDFESMSMLRPPKATQLEVQGAAVASKEMLLTRGAERPWVTS